MPELAMVFWRSEDHYGVGEEGYEYGETGKDDAAQREADRRYWRIDKRVRPNLRLLVAVASGTVARIWPVEPNGEWEESSTRPGAVAIPVGDHPLSDEEVRAQYPSLGVVEGDPWPAEQGPNRRYVTL